MMKPASKTSSNVKPTSAICRTPTTPIHKRSRSSTGGIRELSVHLKRETDSAFKKRQKPVTSCHAFGKAPSSACKSCDECQKLKNLLSEREKQLSIQQQQLKVSETMAEEVTALARRCKAYEQKARRLTVATQSLATKQLGMQALSCSLSGSVDDSCLLQKRSASAASSTRLNRRNFEEKIDRLEASYDLQDMTDENNNNNNNNNNINIDKENQSNIHKRHQSLNINIFSTNGSTSMDDDPSYSSSTSTSLSVKDRILKKKMMNSSSTTTTAVALEPESITSNTALQQQPTPRGRTKSGVSWGPVEVQESPDFTRKNSSSSVINDLTQEFIAAATIQEDQENTNPNPNPSNHNPNPSNPNPNLSKDSSSSTAAANNNTNNEDQKARLAPTTENYTTKSGKKSVKARLLELLSGMDCPDEERFDKMRLTLEIRAFQPKA